MLNTKVGIYPDRPAAGRLLAGLLTSIAGQADTMILALPRGGLPIAYELSTVLNLPWDICLVAKLQVPDQPELAFGALAWEDICVFNQTVMQALGISQATVRAEIAKQKQVLQQRNRMYRQGQPVVNLHNKTLVLCDDGMATGATMRAAAAALKLQDPAQIIVAVPVASSTSCQVLAKEVDEVVCLQTPEPFYSVGQYYQDFSQVSEQQALSLLQGSHRSPSVSSF